MLRPELAEKAIEMKGIEDAQMQEVAPRAKKIFSKRALNTLVGEWNKVAPLFGIKDKYASFSEDTVQLPVEFVKLLSMLRAAISDAVEAEAVPASLAFSLGDVQDDQGLLILASKLKALAGSRDFKDFLMSAGEEPREEKELEDDGSMVRTPEPALAEDDFLSFISKRM